MNVLLIEDEPNVASFIHRGLQEASHAVSIAMDGNMGWDMIRNHEYDVIILDIMLPGINGVELCKRIRKHNEHTPVIMLSALGTSDNVVTGLECGADDYMVKPFKFSELVARIGAVTRRSGTPAAARNRITIDDLVIDLTGKIVTRGDARVNLTATEFKLLEFLARHAGRVFSRSEILEKVWGIDAEINTNVVDVYITYLRRKVDRNSEKKLIQTVVGMGYVIRE